jgi:serine protease
VPRSAIYLVAATALGVALPAGGANPSAVGDAPTARTQLPSQPGLERSIQVARRSLGTKTAQELVRESRKARQEARAGKPCEAIKRLARVTMRAKKARGPGASATVPSILDAATALQLKLLRTPGARKTGCGIGAPKIVVSSTVKPRLKQLPPLKGSPRPVSRLGNADFVSNELLIRTANRAVLNRFIARWRATILSETGPTTARIRLLRIDTEKADVKGLTVDLRALDPLARGTHLVSDTRGLALIAAAADAAASGLTIGINWVPLPKDFLDRDIAEAPGGPLGWKPNPFELSYFRTGGAMDIGVAEAWRVLAGNGKLSNKIRIAVVDNGFSKQSDFEPAWPGQDNIPNTRPCGRSMCPWHGTDAVSILAAQVDNKLGVAGVAGPVADVLMLHAGATEFELVDAIYDAIAARAKIITIDVGYELDSAVSWAQGAFDEATRAARSRGILVFAPAGNDARDIDAATCTIACWEPTLIAPCENDGVICVGGIADNSKGRFRQSNYGRQWCGRAPCDVDIFAPWQVIAGPNPKQKGNHTIGGTSFSAPFAAGVAALAWAGKPALSDDDVEKILLETAHTSDDPSVARYVDALEAVKRTVGNLPPEVAIVTPKDGAVVQYGKANPVRFSANATDPEDGANCCTLMWSASKVGAIGSGKMIDYAFLEPGDYTVTVTAKDSDGGFATAKILLHVANTPPSLTVEFPTPGATLNRNAPYQFVAVVTDPNGDAPCASVMWSSAGPGSTLTGAGCQVTFTHAVAGAWTLIVTAKDAAGASTQRTVQYTVAAAANRPPNVSISTPRNNEQLKNTGTYTFQGSASDPDGSGPLTYRWTVRRSGAGETTIGNSPSISWRPSDTFGPRVCNFPAVVTLEATDAQGATGSESRDVQIVC